jgi:hypothetical protein
MSQGTAKVPISCAVANNGEGIYNSQPCTVYSLQASSTNGNAINVTMTPTSGAFISLNQLTVPATGSVPLYVYVPTSLQGSVNVTASSGGYENNVIPVC